MQNAVPWKNILKQPEAWYHGPEAQRIAGNVLRHQHANGGWEKNQDMTLPPDKPPVETTIDNGATTTEMRFLAKVGTPECREAVIRGLDYLLAAQYPNGGWPQFYPLKKGYYTHITFNDEAMARVLSVLKEAAEGRAEFAFIDSGRRKRCADAMRRGVDCVLKCQIVVRGVKTAWCQQHDEKTFAPAPARKFEPVALCSTESVGLVHVLMRIDPMTPEIRSAIEAAVAWLRSVPIKGQRWERKDGHQILTADPSAPLLWARLYEIGTNRPIFGDRDGKVHYSVTEISQERQDGYAWYSTGPGKLLDVEYPAWGEKQGRTNQRR